MSEVLINTDPHHVASLIFQVWTQEEESQSELKELQELHCFYQHSGCDGGTAPDCACDDADLPRGSTCAQVVSSFLESTEAVAQGREVQR